MAYQGMVPMNVQFKGWERCGQASTSVKTGSPSLHSLRLGLHWAWGAEMASSLALSTVDAPSSRERKPAFSMAEDSLC